MPACRGATIAVAPIAVIPNLDERAAIPRGAAAPLHSSGGKMSTVIDRIETRPANGRPATDDTTPAERLRSTMAAARVSFTWIGTQKTLDPEQKARAAEAFDAEGQFLSAGKKLIDTGHAAFRAVTAIRGKVDAYWRGLEPAVPGARRPADQARRRSSRSPPRWPTSGPSWTTPWPTSTGTTTSSSRPPASGSARCSTRPTIPRPWSASSASSGTSPRRAARLPRAALAGALRGRAGAGRRPGSRRPCSSPSRRSSTSSPGSWPTSATGSRAPARTASRASSATRPSTTSPTSSAGSAR